MGKSARVGWAFVSVALHTLNQVSMSRSVIVVGLGLGGGGVVINYLVCTVSLIMCVTRYRWSTCVCLLIVLFVVVFCCIVGGCASEASHQGSTLSDLSLATGFGPFNLPTCGPLSKGRDHSHVESGRHICMYVFVLFVVVCCLFVYISSLGLSYGNRFFAVSVQDMGSCGEFLF